MPKTRPSRRSKSNAISGRASSRGKKRSGSPKRAGQPEAEKTTTTLTDVARRAGVGESTVSRVMRGHGSFSDRAREKILKAAADLNYVPNSIAGTLASMRSKLVGIIIPSVVNHVVPELLEGTNLVLEEAGFQPVIGVSNYDPAREEALIRSILSWRPTGVIIAGLEHTDRAREMLRQSGIRVAEVVDVDGEGIDIVVGSSHIQAGRKSAEHLISRGYRRIGYVGHNISIDLRAVKRLRGFKDAMRERGLDLIDQEFFPTGGSTVAAGSIGLARLLERQPTLDAVYFSNDDLAVGGYFHCLKNSIAIPRQLALFGYNGIEVSQLTPLPISTIRTHRVAMGRKGAELLLAGGPSRVVDLGFELIPGATS